MQHISSDKVVTFLEQYSGEIKQCLRKIIENTVYVTTDHLLDIVKIKLIEFTKIHQKYNIFIPDDKIGSEHMLILNMQDLLNPVQILYGDNIKLTNDYPIVILDDAIYSSCNMCGHIDNLRYYYKIKNKFYCIVGVTSSYKCEVATDKYYDATVMAYYDFEEFTLSKMFDKQTTQIIVDEFKLECNDVLPLYFSHKIANEFGSYSFYNKVIANPIDRSCISRYTFSDIDEFMQSKTQHME